MGNVLCSFSLCVCKLLVTLESFVIILSGMKPGIYEGEWYGCALSQTVIIMINVLEKRCKNLLMMNMYLVLRNDTTDECNVGSLLTASFID